LKFIEFQAAMEEEDEGKLMELVVEADVQLAEKWDEVGKFIINHV
jgi:hypothetical protein